MITPELWTGLKTALNNLTAALDGSLARNVTYKAEIDRLTTENATLRANALPDINAADVQAAIDAANAEVAKATTQP